MRRDSAGARRALRASARATRRLPRQHADEPGTPRQRGGDTEVPARQRDTGAPRQRGTPRLRAGTPTSRALRASAEPMRRASTPTGRALRASAADTGAPRQRGTDAHAPARRARRALRDSADTCLAACNAWSGLAMGHAAPTSTAEASDVAKPRFSSCTISSRTACGGPTTADNLALRCHAHNALAAEQDFGRSFVQTKRSEAAGAGRRGRAGASGTEKASG